MTSFEGYTSPFWYTRAARGEVGMVSKDPGHQTATLAFVDWLGPLEGLRILDIGCGDGWGMRLLRGKGNHVEGVTLCSNERSFDLAIHLGDMHTFDLLHQELFDMVWMRHSLEHALAPDVVMRNVRRHLRDGGQFCAVLPGPGWDTMPEHRSPMTASQFEGLAARNGFEVVAKATPTVESLGIPEGCPGDIELWFDCKKL